MSAPKLRIAIIGSGIGGLTLALALRQRGVAGGASSRRRELTEIGAAVALSANATRELQRLGVLDAMEAIATEPTELIFRDWRTGRRIAAHPVRQDSRYRERFGAPYLGIHRADLQRILSGALGGEGGLVMEAQRARCSATRANTAFEVHAPCFAEYTLENGSERPGAGATSLHFSGRRGVGSKKRWARDLSRLAGDGSRGAGGLVWRRDSFLLPNKASCEAAVGGSPP